MAGAGGNKSAFADWRQRGGVSDLNCELNLLFDNFETKKVTNSRRIFSEVGLWASL